MIQLAGPSKHGIIVPAVTSTEGTTDRSYLECIKVNGTYVVRRYVTAFSGQVFNFGVPKPEPERRATSSVHALVPVERAAKENQTSRTTANFLLSEGRWLPKAASQ